VSGSAVNGSAVNGSAVNGSAVNGSAASGPAASGPAPRVAIIVVNFNGRQYLADCLGSLAALEYPRERWTAIVVDNGSTDGSRDELRANHPDVRLLALSANRGFAGGNNAGIAWALAAGYDYVALLNNDTRVEPGWLSALVAVAEREADVAACGGKILSWDGAMIEYAGRVFHKETTHGGYSDEPNDGRYSAVSPAAYACGGSCLLRAEALRRLGTFDEDFFAYHEDVDWSLRAWLAGWRVLYVPDSVLYHRRGGTSAGTAFRDYIGPRNALMTWLKCYEPRTWRRFAGTVWRVYNSGPSLRRGLLYNLTVLPRTLAKRRGVQRLRCIADDEFFRRIAG
jgi:GT2 family glycosyltransferase